MHLQTSSISASKCISQLPRSRPPSASLSSTCSRPPSASPNSLDYGLQVHLWVHSIMASQCIAKLAPSRPRSASLSYSISASRCISKLARSRPPSASLSSTRSRPANASPNSLDPGLQVHLPVHTITASNFISKFSQSSVSRCPCNYSPVPSAASLAVCIYIEWLR